MKSYVLFPFFLFFCFLFFSSTSLSLRFGKDLSVSPRSIPKLDAPDLLVEIRTTPEIDKVPSSLKDVLFFQTLRQFFVRFAAAKFCSESCGFWLDAQNVLNEWNTNDDTKRLFEEVVEMYIRKSSMLEVNISSALKKQMIEEAEFCRGDKERSSDFAKSVMEKGIREVTKLLELDLFPKFAMLVETAIAERKYLCYACEREYVVGKCKKCSKQVCEGCQDNKGICGLCTKQRTGSSSKIAVFSSKLSRRKSSSLSAKVACGCCQRMNEIKSSRTCKGGCKRPSCLDCADGTGKCHKCRGIGCRKSLAEGRNSDSDLLKAWN